MFIKFIKEFSVKKILKSSLHNVTPTILENPIQTIGILTDGNYFENTEQLIQEFVQNGMDKNKIKTLVFKDKIKKNEVNLFPTFTSKNMNWNGHFDSDYVTEFINTPFDLLVSYYDFEKTPLLLITHQSKALFKVGFSSIDKRLNHLMINTTVENYKVFAHESFRYLKILNKL